MSELRRIGVVVHPTRSIDRALEELHVWAHAHALEVVQIEAGTNRERPVAAFGDVDACDLVVAVGGDGTVLAALRAAMATGTPVLGVACGSLGALTDVAAADVPQALDRFLDGTWRPRRLPALDVTGEDGRVTSVLNDFVVVRRSGGQIAIDIAVDGERYVRMAGDGVVVATSLGSTAYSMAAGGPVLIGPTTSYVCTPLAMHSGSGPPVVVAEGGELELEIHPGFGGFDVEVDGRPAKREALRYAVRLRPEAATLVSSGEPGHGLEGLRRRRILSDSPRVLARDDRERAKGG